MAATLIQTSAPPPFADYSNTYKSTSGHSRIRSSASATKYPYTYQPAAPPQEYHSGVQQPRSAYAAAPLGPTSSGERIHRSSSRLVKQSRPSTEKVTAPQTAVYYQARPSSNQYPAPAATQPSAGAQSYYVQTTQNQSTQPRSSQTAPSAPVVMSHSQSSRLGRPREGRSSSSAMSAVPPVVQRVGSGVPSHPIAPSKPNIISRSTKSEPALGGMSNMLGLEGVPSPYSIPLYPSSKNTLTP